MIFFLSGEGSLLAKNGEHYFRRIGVESSNLFDERLFLKRSIEESGRGNQMSSSNT